jgi:proprotein convertase subtilisin/kexin type 5
MGVAVSGFRSTSTLPTGTTYTTLISFDSSDGMIDQSLNQIIFSLDCATPCKTCSSSNTSACLSCYNDTAITSSVYFYTALSYCYATCPDTTYNAATLTCEPCDSNCYTCLTTPTFCTKCKTTSSYPYLNITSVTVQTCVSACVAGMYPRTSSDPALCVVCVSPCATCTSQTACITCASGFFLDNVTCTPTCRAGTTIANNATNTCDPCDSICLTCSVSTSNCTACSAPNVYYNGSCQSSCPAGGTLAPLNGICTACDATCLYCSLTITNCTQCNIASTFPYFVSNKCLSSCPEKYYNISLTG